MKRLLVVTLVCAASILHGGAYADFPHHPGAPGIAYFEKEVETYDFVTETVWHEIKAKVQKPRCVTVIEKRDIWIYDPKITVVTKEEPYTYWAPEKKKVPVEVQEIRYLEHTEYKTIHVDHGHWASTCGCYGRCGCQKVWVPRIVEKKVPYTCAVPRLITYTVEKEVIDYVKREGKREVLTSECELQWKTVTQETPVSKRIWEEEEVTIKVPQVTVRKVPCTKTVRVPILGGAACFVPPPFPGFGYPPMTYPPPSIETIPPPPGKEPKKDEPKKEELKKKEEPKKEEPKPPKKEEPKKEEPKKDEKKKG